MGKKNKFSIENKLKRAKKNRNEREINYYTQILEDRKCKKKILKESKGSKSDIEKESKSTFVNPNKLANSRRKKLIENITPSETHIKNILKELNYNYNFQHIVFIKYTQFYILDFYLPELKICIELDGLHHYNDPKQLSHDKERDISLKTKGIDTIRLSNAKALSFTKEDIIELLIKYL